MLPPEFLHDLCNKCRIILACGRSKSAWRASTVHFGGLGRHQLLLNYRFLKVFLDFQPSNNFLSIYNIRAERHSQQSTSVVIEVSCMKADQLTNWQQLYQEERWVRLYMYGQSVFGQHTTTYLSRSFQWSGLLTACLLRPAMLLLAVINCPNLPDHSYDCVHSHIAHAHCHHPSMLSCMQSTYAPSFRLGFWLSHLLLVNHFHLQALFSPFWEQT